MNAEIGKRICNAKRVSTTILFGALATAASGAYAAETGDARGLLEFAAAKTPYLVQYLVPGSDFLSIHGLTFDEHDTLYVGSVMGQSIATIDTRTGETATFVAPPRGLADDLEFGPDGSLAWTSILTGEVYVRHPDGTVEVLADNLPGVNAIAFHPDGRLFVTQVLWGDALWELDPAGKRPPRKVLADIGQLNGFDFDRAGKLYGPLMHKGAVVRIDVDTGAMTTLASGFGVPVAVNLDSRDNLYVADTQLGRIVRIDITNGEQTLIATVDPGIDNLAIDSHDHLFITDFVDNAVYQINTRTGAARNIVRSELSVPGGLDVATENGVDQIYLAELFAFSKINGDSGAVFDLKRGLRDPMEFPMAVNVQADAITTASWFTDAVEVFERNGTSSRATYHNLDDPVDALVLANGDVLVAEQGTGTLAVIDRNSGERTTVAEDIPGLAAMRPYSNDEVYVTDVIAGELSRVNIRSGSRTVIAGGLDRPEGFDLAPDGSIVLAEVGRRRVVRIDAGSGEIAEIARNLAIGYAGIAGSPPAYIKTGVGVSDSGAIYVSSDVNTAIYKITPQ